MPHLVQQHKSITTLQGAYSRLWCAATVAAVGADDDGGVCDLSKFSGFQLLAAGGLKYMYLRNNE